MKKEEIFFRRRQIWNYYTQGYNQIQIAEKLKTSVKTIRRDFQSLKTESIEWFNQLRYGQIQMQHKSNYDSMSNVANELWKIYEKTEDDEKKLKILELISKKTEASSKILSKDIYPTHCERL